MDPSAEGKTSPAVREAFTGEECDRANGHCQRDLEKAIALCEGTTPNLLCIK